jgi:hypothetical protein
MSGQGGPRLRGNAQGDPFQALCARLGDLNPVCGRGKHVVHSVAEQVRVVIDQEQGGHVTRAPAQR